MEGARDTVEELQLLGVKAFPYEVKKKTRFPERLENDVAIKFQADVANYDEIVALKEKIKADLGDVDILINNAGLLARVSLLQGNPEDILRIMKVNLIAHFWVSLFFSVRIS